MHTVNYIIENRYIVYNNVIGEGNSKIYLGKDLKNNYKVAIKQIYYSESNIKLIEKEIEILNKINHKNIIKLLDYVFYNEFVYLIFEYCDGGDLYKYKFNKNENTIKLIYIQITKGLIYLKNMNIYHHDIKPHNILIKNGIIKIADFGFANNFNFICGSPLYMAPELFKLKKFTNKSDIWSLGIILYSLLNDNLPYNLSKCKNIKDIIKSFTNQLVFYNNNISEEVKKFLESILTIDYNKRADWDTLLKNSWIIPKNNINIPKNNINIDKNNINIDKNNININIDNSICFYILNTPVFNNYFISQKVNIKTSPHPIYKSNSIKNKKKKNIFKYTFLSSI